MSLEIPGQFRGVFSFQRGTTESAMIVRGLAASATMEWITNRESRVANAFRAFMTWVGDTSCQAGVFWLGRFTPAEAGTPYPADPLGIRVAGGPKLRVLSASVANQGIFESGIASRECLQGFRNLGWGHASPSRGVLPGTVSAG